ncbi:uncharacterized protein LOC124235121 [Equus quagga]|uniref:uncharacterized protein LOC124235121 n=1 Tax=Equus quagga TaxID=89248 RepID=UPI001EE390CC|nr:uncharacterized protein LOC124235121 [Equus quagga]
MEILLEFPGGGKGERYNTHSTEKLNKKSPLDIWVLCQAPNSCGLPTASTPCLSSVLPPRASPVLSSSLSSLCPHMDLSIEGQALYSITSMDCSEERANDTGSILVVERVPHLSRDAATEWYITAVADEPFSRRHLALKKISEGFQIECGAVASSSTSSASISISLKWASPSISSPDLNRTLEVLMTRLVQARRRLSEDNQAAPLCFRIFYIKDSINAEVLQAEFQTLLETKVDKMAPTLVLVP